MKKIAIYLVAGTLVGNVFLSGCSAVKNANNTQKGAVIGAVGGGVLGAVIGLLGFSRVIKWLLEHYKAATISALIGIMLGTVRLPYVKMASSMAGTNIIAIIALVIIGFFVIYILEKKFKMV